MKEPALRAQVVAGRRRELRTLLVMAADAARRGRQSALRVRRGTESERAVRTRLSSLLVAAR